MKASQPLIQVTKVDSLYADKVYTIIQLKDQRLVFGSLNKLIKVYSFTTFKLLKTIQAHLYAISTMTPLKDGRFVSCGSDRTVKLWNTQTFECEKSFQNKQNAGIAIELKDKRLALGRYDIEIWDISSSECTLVCILESHINNITFLIQLQDQRLISTSNLENKTYVWDIMVEKRSDPIAPVQELKGYPNIKELTDGRLISYNDESIQLVNFKSEVLSKNNTNNIIQINERVIVFESKKYIIFDVKTFKVLSKHEISIESAIILANYNLLIAYYPSISSVTFKIFKFIG